MTTVKARASRPIIPDPVGANPAARCRPTPASRDPAPARLPGHHPRPAGPRGRRYPLSAILAMAAAAVLTVARSMTAIAEWAADTPQSVRAALGARRESPGHDGVPA